MHMPRRCASCGGDLVGLGRFPLQKGRYSLLLGHLGNVLHGALEVSALCCVRCGKVEFYLPEDVLAGLLEENAEQPSIARAACPRCGVLHEIDDAVCPQCGARLMEWNI